MTLPLSHRRHAAKQTTPAGFTLVELLVVLAVMGVLVALLLVGVQASRESARRTQCASNLKNQALALHEFSAVQQTYPAGRRNARRTEYSWCVEVLPQLEQSALARSFDRAKPWDAPANQELADTTLRIFRCPSALQKFPGKTDYGGILGSILSNASLQGIGLDNGVLIEVGRRRGRTSSVRLGEITDGLSNTIAIAECSDRDAAGGGRWVSGLNCFSQDNGGVNATRGDDIYSYHPGGAYAAFADGRVQLLGKTTSEFILGALCTRSGGELLTEF